MTVPNGVSSSGRMVTWRPGVKSPISAAIASTKKRSRFRGTYSPNGTRCILS